MAPGKGSLALLIGKPSSSDEDEGGDTEDMGMGDAKETAARDVMRAIKSGDAAEFSEAFQAMYDACAMSGSEDDDESEDY